MEVRPVAAPPLAAASLISCRKKYRKMRVRFDERMRESNTLFREEHKAIALARRLQEQNEYATRLLVAASLALLTRPQPAPGPVARHQ